MVVIGTDILNDKLFLATEARVSGLSWEAAVKKQTITADELRKLAYDELPRWATFLCYLLMEAGVRDPMAPIHQDFQSHLSQHRLALVVAAWDHRRGRKHLDDTLPD